MSSKSKGPPPGTPPPLFSDNERVLCFHGPLIYEGKVLKVEYKEKDQGWACFIHYAGWSKSWDEFVPETRVLKWTPENLQRQKEHKMAHEDQVRSTKKAEKAGRMSTSYSGKKRTSIAGDSTSSANVSVTDSRPSTPTPSEAKSAKSSTKGATQAPGTSASAAAALSAKPMDITNLVDLDLPSKKRKRGEHVENELTYLVKQEVEIKLPEKFRIFLVDDWDSVCRQKKLLNVPSRHTVDSVIESYLKTKKDGEICPTELCAGIRDYFNSMLGNQLLYRFERFQYADVIGSKRKPSTSKDKDEPFPPMTSVYGPVHLLRLFTRLGSCLSYTTLNSKDVKVLQKSLDDFFQFLLEHFEEYFSLDEYGLSAPEYQRKAPA